MAAGAFNLYEDYAMKTIINEHLSSNLSAKGRLASNGTVVTNAQALAIFDALLAMDGGSVKAKSITGYITGLYAATQHYSEDCAVAAIFWTLYKFTVKDSRDGEPGLFSWKQVKALPNALMWTTIEDAERYALSIITALQSFTITQRGYVVPLTELWAEFSNGHTVRLIPELIKIPVDGIDQEMDFVNTCKVAFNLANQSKPFEGIAIVKRHDAFAMMLNAAKAAIMQERKNQDIIKQNEGDFNTTWDCDDERELQDVMRQGYEDDID